MKRDFPHSMDVISLIRSMEPGKLYYPFELRGMTGGDHKTIWEAKHIAEKYGIIKEEHLFGRINRYQLTPKGCDYHNRIIATRDENFISILKKIEKQSKIPTKENKVKEQPKIPLEIKDISDRLGIKLDIKLAITPAGKNYLNRLKINHEYISNFSDIFSKRRKRIFGLETDEISILETFEQKEEITLINLINETKRNNRRMQYKYTILPLIEKGYLSQL